MAARAWMGVQRRKVVQARLLMHFFSKSTWRLLTWRPLADMLVSSAWADGKADLGMSKVAKKIPLDRQCEKCGKCDHEDRELDVAVERGSGYAQIQIRICRACLRMPFDWNEIEQEHSAPFLLSGGPRARQRCKIIGIIGSPAFPATQRRVAT